MHPVLFHIGKLTFYTYGLIMAIAFIAAYFYLLRLAKTTGQDPEFYSNMFFWLMLFGILGAKILYLIVGWRNLGNELRDLVGCLRGGLVWYGGVIADLVFVYFYCRTMKKDLLKTLDTLSSPSALGLAIGRWGCLMAGCCYGRETHLPWAITYPRIPEFPHPMAGIPVHPSPIYESIGALIIALVCYQVFRHANRKGLAITFLILLYSVLRFFLEFMRGDVERGFVIPNRLSTSQLVSILMFLPAVYFLIHFLRKPSEAEKKEESASSKQAKKQKAKDKGK